MPEDLFIPVEKQVTKTEQVGVTMKELTLLAATPSTPGVLSIVLAPLDEQGEWRSDVQPVLVRVSDTLATEDVPANPIASLFHLLMLSAVVNPAVPEIAYLMNLYGIPEGTTVKDASKIIIPHIMAGGA